MTQAPTGTDERSKELRLRILVVLAVGFFLMSLSAALVSGYFLMRGDRGTSLDRALPASCEWVVASRDPAMLVDVLRTLEQDPARLPEAVSPVAAWLGPLRAGLERGATGLDLSEPWAACAVDDGWLFSLALAEAADAAQGEAAGAQAFIDALAPRLAGLAGPAGASWQSGAPWGMDRAQVRRLGAGHALALLTAGRRAFVRLQPGDEKAALLRLSELTTPLTRVDQGDARVADGTLRDRPAFREAVERVGGGALQVWLPSAALAAWLQGRGLPAVLVELAGLEETWWASSVRLDDGALVVHQHLSGGQRVVVFAKQHLDPRVPLEADAHLPADGDVSASLVLRYGPETWVRHWNRLAAGAAAERGGLGRIDAFLQAKAGAGLRELVGGGNGQLLLTVRGEGPQARWVTLWPRAADAPRPAAEWPASARGDGLVFARRGAVLALGNDGDVLQRALDAFEGAGPTWRDAFADGAIPQTDVDLYRQHGGGLVRGANALQGLIGAHPPLRIEWLWLDTGLIVETRLLPRTKRATLPQG